MRRGKAGSKSSGEIPLFGKQIKGASINLLFGTFSNSKEYVQEVGFDKSREKRVHEMLKNKDVYKT